MNETVQIRIVRHTKNYEVMVEFYRVQAWAECEGNMDHPGSRGTLLSFGGKSSNTVIEVIQLEDEAVPGVKPVNVVLSIEIPAVDEWHD